MRGKTRLFVGFVCLFTAVFLFMGGCGGGSGSSDMAGSLGAPGVIGDQDNAVATLDRAPESPDTSKIPPGRSAASVWSGCPTQPPDDEAWSADSGSNNDPNDAFDGDHSNNSVWYGASLNEWDIYRGFGSDPNNPALELSFLAVNFFSDSYTPDTVRLYTSNDPCNAGWTDRGLLTANTWDASNPYIDLGSIIETNYIWLHMEDSGTYMAIRDVDWEPVNLNVGAHAWPSYDATLYYPSMAFDGNNSSTNSWVGKISAGTWNLYYGFDSPTLVEMVSADLFSTNYHPTTMNVYTSDTGTDGSWTLVGKMGPTPIAAQYVGATTSYVRIEMTGNPPSNFPYIKEITWNIPVGASSGDEYSSYYTADKAFDGDMNTWWTGATGQSKWELFKRYPNPQFIEHIDVTFYASSHTPQTTELHCFNNGTWTDIGTFPLAATTDMDVNAVCEILRFEMDGNGSYPSVGYPLVKDIAINKQGWIELSGSATGNGVSGDSSFSYLRSIAADSNGYPVIAWAGNYETPYEDELDIFLKRWDGSSWVDVAGADTVGEVTDDQTSTAPSMVLDSSNNPYIAYGHWDGDDYDVYLQYWTGSVWDDLNNSASGSGISGTGDASAPDMVLDNTGKPIVTWYDESSGKKQIYVRRWDGSNWVEMDYSASGNGISNSSTRAEYPKITLNGSGEPVITWVDNLFNIYAKRWNGSSWVEIGSGSASNGGISNAARFSNFPDITTDNNGNPLIAWVQAVSDDNTDIYLRRWDGSSWNEVGGSVTSGGISDSADMNFWPSVFTNDSGDIFVSYDANISGQTDILVKKWNGSSWAGIDGSATGGGISNNAQNSTWPSVTVDNNGNPMVAWNNFPGGSAADIFFKRWLP